MFVFVTSLERGHLQPSLSRDVGKPEHRAPGGHTWKVTGLPVVVEAGGGCGWEVCSVWNEELITFLASGEQKGVQCPGSEDRVHLWGCPSTPPSRPLSVLWVECPLVEESGICTTHSGLKRPSVRGATASGQASSSFPEHCCAGRVHSPSNPPLRPQMPQFCFLPLFPGLPLVLYKILFSLHSAKCPSPGSESPVFSVPSPAPFLSPSQGMFPCHNLHACLPHQRGVPREAHCLTPAPCTPGQRLALVHAQQTGCVRWGQGRAGVLGLRDQTAWANPGSTTDQLCDLDKSAAFSASISVSQGLLQEVKWHVAGCSLQV